MKRIWGLVLSVAQLLFIVGLMLWYVQDSVDRGFGTWGRAGIITLVTVVVIGLFMSVWLWLERVRPGADEYIHATLAALFCLGVFLTLGFGMPLLVTWPLFLWMNVNPQDAFGIFAFLFVQGIFVTFLGGWMIRWGYRLLDDPTEKERAFVQKVGRVDLFKFMYFSFYLLLLLVSGYLRFEHKHAFGLSDEAMAPVLQGFATYIALDRVVNAVRKVKEG